MRTLLKVALTLAAIALVAAPVLAQGQRRQGQRPPGGFGPGQGGVAMLLTNKSVQEELKMTEDQVAKAKEFGDKQMAKMREVGQTLRDLSQEERREKMQALQKEAAEAGKKAVADILKSEQAKRLHQIELQQQGPRAYADAEVQKTLKITDEQKEKIKTINDDLAKEMRELFQPGGNFQEAAQKRATLNKEAGEKIVAVLTDEQKKAWKELTGEPFTIKIERPMRPDR